MMTLCMSDLVYGGDRSRRNATGDWFRDSVDGRPRGGEVEEPIKP